MDFRNCPRCGAVFTYMTSPICPKCEAEEEEILEKLKDYITENPGSTIMDVSQAMDVSEKKILRFVKEGRLELINTDADSGVKCEQCGKPITKGRLCDSCYVRYNQQVKEMFGKNEESVKPKMHTYRKSNIRDRT